VSCCAFQKTNVIQDENNNFLNKNLFDSSKVEQNLSEVSETNLKINLSFNQWSTQMDQAVTNMNRVVTRPRGTFSQELRNLIGNFSTRHGV
jgi:cupin superfamily acireductone dioxygenase involved in methionine salvage